MARDDEGDDDDDVEDAVATAIKNSMMVSLIDLNTKRLHEVGVVQV